MPACLQVPDGVLGSYRDDVGELMALAGRPLDPHQLVAVEALTSYGRGGRWPSFVAGVEGPRQTVGKTGGILLPVALFLCLTFPELADERTWTAHRLDTTSKTFRDARQLLGVDDEDRRKWEGPLSLRVRNVGLENGNEHIEFVNGSILWFKARSGRAGRGLSGHDVFADELLYAEDAQFGALLPTMATRSAQGMPRLWTGSSSALAASAFLRRLRGRAVAGDQGVTYVGWWADGSWERPGCADDRCTHVAGAVQGCSLDDRARWRQANPGLGVRTSEEFLVEMRGTLTAVEFGREFLGWQESSGDVSVTIPLAAWADRCDESSAIGSGSPRVLSLDVNPDRSRASIGGAGWRVDGDMHIDLVDYRPGTSWVVPRLLDIIERQRPAAVVVDGASPAGALIDELARHGVARRTESAPYGLLVVMGAQDMARACGQVFDGIAGDAPSMWHRDEPILTAALQCAVRRDVGDGGWALGRRKSEGDISPMVAVIEAAWGLSSVPAQQASEVF